MLCFGFRFLGTRREDRWLKTELLQAFSEFNRLLRILKNKGFVMASFSHFEKRKYKLSQNSYLCVCVCVSCIWLFLGVLIGNLADQQTTLLDKFSLSSAGKHCFSDWGFAGLRPSFAVWHLAARRFTESLKKDLSCEIFQGWHIHVHNDRFESEQDKPRLWQPCSWGYLISERYQFLLSYELSCLRLFLKCWHD